MCKKRQPYLYNVPMLALDRTILLMSMWAGNMMRDPDPLKERI
jgi:hypothetical protein